MARSHRALALALGFTVEEADAAQRLAAAVEKAEARLDEAREERDDWAVALTERGAHAGDVARVLGVSPATVYVARRARGHGRKGTE